MRKENFLIRTVKDLEKTVLLFWNIISKSLVILSCFVSLIVLNIATTQHGIDDFHKFMTWPQTQRVDYMLTRLFLPVVMIVTVYYLAKYYWIPRIFAFFSK